MVLAAADTRVVDTKAVVISAARATRHEATFSSAETSTTTVDTIAVGAFNNKDFKEDVVAIKVATARKLLASSQVEASVLAFPTMA